MSRIIHRDKIIARYSQRRVGRKPMARSILNDKIKVKFTDRFRV